MIYRKKIKTDNQEYIKVFSNWLAQLCSMIMTRFFYLIAGRGSSKTTEFQVERLIEMVYDMPGAPICWVSDTYSNLQKNVLPMVLEGLERKGFKEGVHFVVEKAPPVYTEAEKEELPDWLKECFWTPYNKFASYKHTFIFFTGFNITFGSLDRPASLAGRSYVHVIGDEVKYFKEEKISNLLKAVRGYKEKYGKSVFYRGHTFTTDMPNPNNIGEYDWILRQGKKMNKKSILLVLKVAFILNEALQELLAAKEENATDDIIVKQRIYDKWKERHYIARMDPDAHTFYYVASSYVNVDILTPDWFKDAFETDMSDTKTAILSMLPTLEGGDRFYANLREDHFYWDGIDEYWSDYFGLRGNADCRILKYLRKGKAIECGIDCGNMMSMSIFQYDEQTNIKRFIDFIYTLSPEWIPQLADKFVKFYEEHDHKVLIMHYDRAANSYKDAKQDLASQIKNAIETYQSGAKKGQRTGWIVRLASLNQGNIGQDEEYAFMQELLPGRNKSLPKILIDGYRCKPLKCSLELARTKISTRAKGGEYISKNKSSESLPINRLPFESTNASDSFKYACMTREARKALIKRNSYVGGVSSI